MLAKGSVFGGGWSTDRDLNWSLLNADEMDLSKLPEDKLANLVCIFTVSRCDTLKYLFGACMMPRQGFSQGTKDFMFEMAGIFFQNSTDGNGGIRFASWALDYHGTQDPHPLLYRLALGRITNLLKPKPKPKSVVLTRTMVGPWPPPPTIHGIQVLG